MRAIASVNTGATDSTLMLSSFFSLVSGMVSRMVSSLIAAVLDALDRRAGENAVALRRHRPRLRRRSRRAPRLRCTREPAVSTISSTRMHFLPLTLPMTFMTSDTDCAFGRRLSTMASVHVELRWQTCALRATEPTSGETTTMSSVPMLELAGDVTVTSTEIAEHVIHGNVEEALDLRCMQVHGQHAVCACSFDHVRDELRGDRVAALGSCGPGGRSRSTG